MFCPVLKYQRHDTPIGACIQPMIKWLLYFCASILACLPATAAPNAGNTQNEERFEQASNVVVGKIIDREITRDDQDPDWDLRNFRYQLLIEAVEKGDLNRGDTIAITASAGNWIGTPNETLPWSLGHRPLPLSGERGRFFISKGTENAFEVLLPNGVELDSSADPDDPQRIGEAAKENIADTSAAEDAPTSKDPFGWDVILILLGIPFIVGAIRQKSRSRWGLLVVGTLMFLAAVIITMSS